MPELRSREVSANGVEFAVLEAGSGPLALCLHGFPDSAHTWRHLLPVLAESGFHAVAPFMRGFAPTAVPGDGCFSLGALIADANALHDVLGADAEAVLIGSDWGAEAAYGAAAYAPERWRRLVTLAIPPLSMDAELFTDFDQLRRFFYMFLFTQPVAEMVVSADEMAFIDRLWAEWSPGHHSEENLAIAKDCIREPDHLAAALGYYRAALGAPAESCAKFAAEQSVLAEAPSQPTLYLHGDRDGCIGVDLVRDAEAALSPGSRFSVVEEAGHFLQLERPELVNAEILDWISSEEPPS
ncbi:MAG TPA: alpha/beta hydrolase [Solirubrobacterales bacterium]|nr:alpha/beta hydrolase [Solirubrobacterales bacterium]